MKKLYVSYFSFSRIATKFDPSKNYYQILNIQPCSSKKIIRNAYLGLAKKYHPDVNPTTKDKFSLIQEAYEVLSNADTKKDYDQAQRSSSESKYEHPRRYDSSQQSQRVRKQQEFKGQSTYKKQRTHNWQYSNHQEVDLKAQREKWKKQFYECLKAETKIKQPKEKPKTPEDEEYQKMQFLFSNKNHFAPWLIPNSSSGSLSQGGLKQFWEKMKGAKN